MLRIKRKDAQTQWMKTVLMIPVFAETDHDQNYVTGGIKVLTIAQS